MKKAALITGLLFWVATSFTVFAQESTDPLVQLPIMVDCGPTQQIDKILEGYEEVPVAKADVMWRLPSGDFLSGPLTIFAHPEKRTISMVIQPSEDFACIAFPGNNFGPYADGKET
jgi:hypothetical protein